MPHIRLPEGLPGLREAIAFRPQTAKPLSELAEALLRAPNSLTPAERELIATHVSAKNSCDYCEGIHGAVAAAYLGDGEVVRQVKCDFASANISKKLKALLAIAGRVQKGGKLVTTQDIERAHACGATDVEIHDAVLIAAAFCMYNRYVDGLATTQPADEDMFRQHGAEVARRGYVAASEDAVAQPTMQS